VTRVQLGACEWCDVVGSHFAFLRIVARPRSEWIGRHGRVRRVHREAHEFDEVDRIEPIRPVLARVIDRWQPLQIWLFGSRARGENRPDSDWDLLATCPIVPSPPISMTR